jgi:hypothetical protein
MQGSRAVWAFSTLVAAANLACGSSVTTETTNGGGNSTTTGGGTGGTATAAGNGGVAGDPTTGGGGEPGGSGGTSTGGGLTGGGGTGGSQTCPSLGNACSDCLSNDCAEVWCGCYNEPHCGGYFECLGFCMMGDMDCFQNCATAHQDGISAAILVSDCAATTCDGTCMFGQPLMGCQKCLYTECPTEMNACIAEKDGDCIAFIQCAQMCMPGDMMCFQTCIDEHQAGAMLAQDVNMCLTANCDAACP